MGKFEPRKFVEVWMAKCDNASLQDIANEFGVSRQYVEQYSQGLRKRGVKLPKLRKGPHTQRQITEEVVADLNKIIEKAES